jgi:hypothetical protein
MFDIDSRIVAESSTNMIVLIVPFPEMNLHVSFHSAIARALCCPTARGNSFSKPQHFVYP